MPQVRGILLFLSEETLVVYYSPGQLPLQARAVIESTPRCQTLPMCYVLIAPVPLGGGLGGTVSELK